MMSDTDPIRVIVIDDEKEGRDVILHLLQAFDDVSIAGEAADADEGLDLILREKPNLVFLDIQMPKKKGFDLVQQLSVINLSPAVVFVTAFDQFAIQAIRHAAFDFLTKPVDPDELSQTILRFRLKKEAGSFNERVKILLEQVHPGKKIRFNTRTGFLAVNPEEILYIRADANYSDLYLSETKKEVICMNIGSVEEMLPAEQFFRTSRSVIINLAFLHSVNRKSRQCELVKDMETVFVEIAREQIQELEKRI